MSDNFEPTSVFEIPVSLPVKYQLTGKFVSPNSDWMHENFELIDFELIIVTDGILHIKYHNIAFTIGPGEYLLLPPFCAPDNRRRGFKPSECSFYWLHFLPAEPFRTFPSLTEFRSTASEQRPA